jgi:hypothetical protein
MKNCLPILIAFSCFMNCFGQNTLAENKFAKKYTGEYLFQTPVKPEKADRKITPPNLALSPGIVFQKQTFGELNLLVGRYESSMSGNAFGGVRLGAETNFRKGPENIWAPKIGVELSGMVICVRGTMLYYIADANRQFCFLPELGISFLGFANLTYGYNFKLSPGTIDGIVRHRVCLSLNLNPQLMGDAFGF